MDLNCFYFAFSLSFYLFTFTMPLCMFSLPRKIPAVVQHKRKKLFFFKINNFFQFENCFLHSSVLIIVFVLLFNKKFLCYFLDDIKNWKLHGLLLLKQFTMLKKNYVIFRAPKILKDLSFLNNTKLIFIIQLLTTVNVTYCISVIGFKSNCLVTHFVYYIWSTESKLIDLIFSAKNALNKLLFFLTQLSNFFFHKTVIFSWDIIIIMFFAMNG